VLQSESSGHECIWSTLSFRLSILVLSKGFCMLHTHTHTQACMYTGHSFKCKTCTVSSVMSLYNSFPVVWL